MTGLHSEREASLPIPLRTPEDTPTSSSAVASAMAALAAIVLVCVLWSCADPSEYSGEDEEAPARASLSPDPVWVVGSADGPEAEIFFRISGARRLSDGSVVVGVDGFHEIRKFGPDGAHLWTAGRRGRGPGEFERLQLLRGCSEERVVAYDRSIFRVTEFSQDGERLAAWQVPSGASVPYEVTCAPDGRIIYFTAGQFPSEPGIVRWHVPISWISRGMQGAQLIRDEVPGPERVLDDGYWDRPWSRRLVFGGTDRGVWIGTSDDYKLELVGWDGTVLDTLAWSGRDRAVTSADRMSLRRGMTRRRRPDSSGKAGPSTRACCPPLCRHIHTFWSWKTAPCGSGSGTASCGCLGSRGIPENAGTSSTLPAIGFAK